MTLEYQVRQAKIQEIKDLLGIVNVDIADAKDKAEQASVNLEELQDLLKDVRLSGVCVRCNGTGRDGHDRCVPPNEYICPDCDGLGLT